jgi:hypothetical protein
MDRADFESIVSKFDEAARDRGYPISEDYACRWLLAESVTNPQFKDTFSNRYQSPDNLARAERLIKEAQDRFLAAAKKVPDPEGRF